MVQFLLNPIDFEAKTVKRDLSLVLVGFELVGEIVKEAFDGVQVALFGRRDLELQLRDLNRGELGFDDVSGEVFRLGDR